LLEALGVGLEVEKTDVAIRCNFSTLRDGLVADRRAGRIPTEESRKLVARLQEEIRAIDGVEIIFAPGMEHRFAVVLRFPEPLPEGSDNVNDTDPQKEGKAPLIPEAGNPQSEAVAKIAGKLIEMAVGVLKDEPVANFVLLRGISQLPSIPSFEYSFGLRALAIAVYPMYRGLARLVGMDTISIDGDIREEIECLKENYDDYDFFFLHVKKIDSYGEDGNFEAKAGKLEEFDAFLPEILELNPDVLIITGDHSTPCTLKSHSWHPVPVILSSPFVLGGLSSAFTERECVKGEFGIFPAVHLLPLALANSNRLKKFGA
jgi:2,3-bisphosphoglycerate-independent phosphoglycerate mutase